MSRIYMNLIFIILICFKKLVLSDDDTIDLLDLHNDPGIINTSEKKGPLETIKSIPVSRNKYKTVREADKIIYECSGDNEGIDYVTVQKYYGKIKLINITISTEDYYETENKFFFKFIHNWYLIDQDIYEMIFDGFLTERNMDIYNFQDDGTFIIEEHNLHGLKGTVFLPKEEFQLVGVLHNGKPIWMSKDQSFKCTSLIVHGELQSTILVNANVKYETDEDGDTVSEKEESGHHELKDGKEAEQKEPCLPGLLEKLEIMKNEKLEELKEKLKEELKSLSPDEDPEIMYIPTLLRSIFEDQHSEQEFQETASAEPTQSLLCQQIFYEKINEKWTKVSKSEFYTKLNELDEEMLK
uniref:SfiI-subtelomeric related protein family member n=1 Tax=Theileria annulata TaxID=5874 RepID=A0A3B0MPR9_THEAN